MAYFDMTSSVSRRDEPNLALCLATRAGKMELSCPLGIRALSRKENLSCFSVLSHIIYYFIDQACSIEMAGYWPRSIFCVDHKHAKKELGQYPAILTSSLVNNPYLRFLLHG